MAQEKNMSASQPHSFLLRSLYHTFLQDLYIFLEFSLTVYYCYCSRVGTFGTESAVRKRGGSRNLPYLNAKPRQIPLLGTYACTVTYYFHSFQGALPSCHICSSCILSRWVSIHFQKPSWRYTISCPSLASCSNGAFSKTVSSPSI